MSADTVVTNMSYRDGATDQAATAIRDIAGAHLFNDGNKRTAEVVASQVLGSSSPELRDVVTKTATGELRSVEQIAEALSRHRR